jgi:hypothetical protein
MITDERELIRADYIAQLQTQHSTIYHPPLPHKRQRTTPRTERSGKVVHYTREQIFLYQLRHVAQTLGGKS